MSDDMTTSVLNLGQMQGLGGSGTGYVGTSQPTHARLLKVLLSAQQLAAVMG
jgi:hypothetical protein